MRIRLVLLIAILFTLAPIVSANDLSQQTITAWDRYIQSANSRFQQRVASAETHLWIDDVPGGRERVRQGDILVEPANEESPRKVPLGLIHDWIGSSFIPNTTIDAVFGVLNDYERYKQVFNPAVIDAKLLRESGDSRDFSLLIQEKAAFVSTAIKSEYTSRTVQLNQHDWYTISYSTRIQQIADYGKTAQHDLPPDTGTGYVWRVYSIERFQERDGGIYIELEGIALSRNVPFELQWLVRPILQRLPRNSMTATLQKTRDAVCSENNSHDSELAKTKRTPEKDAVRRGIETQGEIVAPAAFQGPHN